MLIFLYEAFRGASGFALMFVGLSYFFERRRERVRLALGLLLFASGFLFLYSALDPLLRSPAYLGTCILALSLFVIGQSTFELAFFLLGDESMPRSSLLVRRCYISGGLWTLLVCLLPLADYALMLSPISTSIEDANRLGPFHLAASIAVYALPVGSSAVAAIGGYIKAARFGPDSRQSFALVAFFALLVASIAVAVLSLALSRLWPYRAAHTVMQLSLMSLHLYLVRHPESLVAARREIRVERKRRTTLGPEELRKIELGLERAARDDRLIYDSDFSLARLAASLDMPPYKVTLYFGQALKTHCAEWINGLRVARAKELLLAGDESFSTLDIAFECGFGSKSVFNAQFKKITGLSPRDFKKRGSPQGVEGRSPR